VQLKRRNTSILKLKEQIFHTWCVNLQYTLIQCQAMEKPLGDLQNGIQTENIIAIWMADID